MQKNSIQTLSKLAVPLKSKGRFFKEKKTSLRSDFQRDRDRIIHSTAFRRLKHKTQVFVNTSGDHFRTRITHSLEVAQIARTLSKFFNLNNLRKFLKTRSLILRIELFLRFSLKTSLINSEVEIIDFSLIKITLFNALSEEMHWSKILFKRSVVI